MAVVKIPMPLRGLTGGAREVSVRAPTVAEMLDELEARYPGLKARLCDEDGGIRSFVNLFVSGEDIRLRQGLATELEEGDEVYIVPAVSGGAPPSRARPPRSALESR